MKKKIFLFIFIFLLITNVYADEYPKSYEEGKYSIYVTKVLKCDDKDVEYAGYITDGNLYVEDDDGVIYIWNEDNTCKKATPQEILDMYYNIEDDSSVEDDVITVKKVLSDDAHRDGHMINTEPYDPTISYKESLGNDAWRDASVFNTITDANVNNFYIEYHFYRVNSTVYDPTKTYYKISSEIPGKFEVYTEPFTEEEALDIYIREEEYEGFTETSKDYTFTHFDDIETVYGEDSFDSLYFLNGKVIADVSYFEGEVNLIKHVNDNMEEVYTEYNNHFTLGQFSNYIVFYYTDYVSYTDILIADLDGNLITKIVLDYPAFINLFSPLDDAFVLGFFDASTWEFNFYYYKLYYLEEGDKQSYDKGTLTFKFNGELEYFDKLKINNVVVDSSNYTLKSGSTILELKEEYLKTLEKGNYSITAVYKNGSEVSATFTKTTNKEVEEVVKEENPVTGDNILISAVVAGVSLLSITILLLSKKEKNN